MTRVQQRLFRVVRDLWGKLKEQRVGPLGSLRVRLDCARAVQSSLDQDVQRDGRRLAGQLHGRGGEVRLDDGNGPGKRGGRWREQLHPGRRWGYVGGQWERGLRHPLGDSHGRPVLTASTFRNGKGHCGVNRGRLGNLSGEGWVYRVVLVDGGRPFGWDWWGALSRSNDSVQAAAGLRELSCGEKEAKKKTKN